MGFVVVFILFIAVASRGGALLVNGCGRLVFGVLLLILAAGILAS